MTTVCQTCAGTGYELLNDRPTDNPCPACSAPAIREGAVVTYIQKAIEAVSKALPREDPELIRLYALLALVTGEATSRQDVHDAWAIWRDRTNPEHRAIIPFAQLAPSTQELDQPYVDAIHRAAASLVAEANADLLRRAVLALRDVRALVRTAVAVALAEVLTGIADVAEIGGEQPQESVLELAREILREQP